MMCGHLKRVIYGLWIDGTKGYAMLCRNVVLFENVKCIFFNVRIIRT